MNTRIITENIPEDWPTFEVTDRAVVHLWKHGWEPPAGQAFDISLPDGETLVIPARPMQRSAQPTAEQLETIIINRIQSRISLGGGLQGNFIYAYQQGIKDAAEAIHDLISDPS